MKIESNSLEFHEVTHHLINQNGELISEIHDATLNQEGEFDRQVERLCNIGAAEFLMPREKFTKLYKEKGFNVELIPFAASCFGSSTIATTIQLAQIAPNSCITAICEHGLVPNKAAHGFKVIYLRANIAPPNLRCT